MVILHIYFFFFLLFSLKMYPAKQNKNFVCWASVHISMQIFLTSFYSCIMRMCHVYSVQVSHSVVFDFLQPHGLQHARLSCPSPTPRAWATPMSLSKLMSIKLVMPFNYLVLCRPLLLLPSIFPSIRVFSNESVLRIRWAK